MMRKLLLLLILFVSTYSFATHVVGGEIIYQHVGGSSYILTLKLYRDCDPASVDFPNSTTVIVDEGDGTSYGSFNLPMLIRDTLNPALDTCAFDPGICVEEAIYQSVVSLPPGSGGYHLHYTLCCRNGSIDNINNPLNARETFYAYVPDNNIYLTNSSPVITNFPPVYVCNQQDLSLDFGATDADGDSLVYSFYTPYDGVNGGGISYNAATPPNNFQASPVTWLPSFSATSPLDPAGSPGLTIDPQTGFITGSPVMQGQFVVGVRVDEYRDGTLIGRITRDFQFNVVNCPPPQDAGIGPVDACSGLSITFDNQSGAGANGFWWDFGTGNPADTSIVYEPTFAYPSIGTYPITLIAQKGTLCADTAYYNMIVSGLVPDFNAPDTVCIGEAAQFTDLSVPAANGNVNAWEWDFGDGSTSNLQNPTHAYGASGDYTVQLIAYTDVGCVDTFTQDIHVKIPPQAGITPMPGCNGLSVTFGNNSDPGATGLWWEFGTSFPADTSILSNPTFNYTGYGVYTVTLVAQKGTACADTATYDITLSDVTSDFTAPDTTCSNVLVSFTDASFTSGGGAIDTWQWDFDGAGSSTQQNPNIGFATAGTYNVQLISSSDLGCIDSITIPIVVIDAPIADIGPTDFCAGLTIDFANNSGPGSNGFHWDFGTGNPADTSDLQNPTFTYPGFGSYTVTLTAQSGTVCQTIATLPIIVSEINADFVAADTACQGSIIAFNDASTTQAGTTITDWDWNFGDLNVSSQQNPQHSYNTSGTIPVQLIVESNIGCIDTITYDVEIMAPPVANAGLDTAVCVSNPSYQLNGAVVNVTGGVWSGNGGVFTPSAANLTATYFPSLGELNAGSTDLVLTTAATPYCAADTDTITIFYLSTPTIDAGLTIEVCDDTTYIQMDGTVQFATNIVWTTTGAGSFNDDSQLDAIYTFSPGEIVAGDSILFMVETFNFSGCPDDQDSVWLFFNSPPTMNVVFDDTVCAGFPIPLNSNSTTGNGLWTTSGDGIFNPDSSDATLYDHGANDEANGNVTIYFESLDNGGCPTLYDTLLITIVPSPDPGFSFVETCFGTQTVFTDSSSSIDPITNWDWTFEPGQTSTSQNPTYNFLSPGVHPVQLIVTSANGCQDTLIVDVTSHYIPNPNFVVPFPCIEPFTQFIDSSTVVGDSIVSWSWDFGDGSGNSNQQNPTYVYGGTSVYSINLSVTSGFGCTNDTTIATQIFQGPNGGFNFNPTSGNVGQDIYFSDASTADVNPIVNWLYNFGDSTGIFGGPDAVHVYDPEGEYTVTYIVIDAVGCTDTVTAIIPVYHGPLVPSAFTPNGDGNNDFLMILGGNFSSVDFKIYNNWGEVIYETIDPNDQGWDGTYKGVDQPLGVYVYTAVVTTFDGEEHVLKGDVSLIR
ncbi:PKD domain-containing protein [Paracrocinitomix mangrovi]|uniref:PKD domain-containing protein n=1 Tax=Paracrocinitomix mangrovi TaxID=2862509 RepID=UPI001EDA5044|nr:PKD domain-containing protein [Paracrocinitomix mangrovi]UKN02999.1 PKD domain-containing protein [Paracrocinitomix mangrovi]